MQKTTAEQAVITAAKEWARTRLTRTSSGLRDRLIQAVKELEGEENDRQKIV